MPRKSLLQSSDEESRRLPRVLRRKRRRSGEDVSQTTQKERRSRRKQEFPEEVKHAPLNEAILSDSPESESSSMEESSEDCRNGRITPLDAVMAPTWSRFRGLIFQPATVPHRHMPLPPLSWASRREVWELMCHKDLAYTRERNLSFMEKNPSLQPHMRSILLEWLIEVCEVYKLHRETYALAVDFIDRYLTTVKDTPKSLLQLIGVTCLFIAAKIEEIYPPKIQEFSYVTDGACKEDEIMVKELIIMKALGWDLAPITANYWLSVYLQLLGHSLNSCEDLDVEHRAVGDGFSFPQVPAHHFCQTARLLDLSMLDVNSLKFPYSYIAAAALSYTSGIDLALNASGLSRNDLAPCIKWMEPFDVALKEVGPAEQKRFENVHPDNLHNIQSHDIDLKLLERAQTIEVEIRLTTPPRLGSMLLTPPNSDEKEHLRNS